MPSIAKIGNVFFPADDVLKTAEFYKDALGLSLKFIDGNRWASFSVAGATFAVASVEESGGRTEATVSLLVEGGLSEFVAELREKGVSVSEPKVGRHERSALVEDPSGHTVILNCRQPARLNPPPQHLPRSRACATGKADWARRHDGERQKIPFRPVRNSAR